MSTLREYYNQHKTISIIFVASIAFVLLLVLVKATIDRQHIDIAEPVSIYVPSGSDFEALTDSLKAHDCIVDEVVFRGMAKTRKLDRHVKPGRYVVEPGMSVVRLVGKLYSGNQDAVRVTVNRHRTNEQLCRFFASKLEMEADSLLVLLNDSETTEQYGFTPETIIGMFVQNTYDIYWTTTPQKLLDRMKKEYDRFWNAKRRGECMAMGMSQQEVITLASIVDEETNKDNEKSTIASVYLNRLRKGMALQADPTVKYAVGDFGIRRILHKHLEVNSPYNTYKNIGLPPGPICMPSISSIDAVLANRKTDYLYFCAKEDFSGYHNFAATPDEHARNAQRFHQALNKKGIK